MSIGIILSEHRNLRKQIVFKMVIILVLFCTVLMEIQGLPNQKYTATFDLHVAEKGALFDQNLKTDIINDVIYYHTPAHNDLNEMYKVQDFKKNIEVSCYPSKMECYKANLDRNLYQDASHTSESLLMGQRNNGNHLTSEKQTNVYIKKWYKKGIFKDLDLLGSESAKEFVEGFGFTLYETELIPDNAEFLDTNITIGHRQKRQLVEADKCNNDVAPVIKYGFTDTSGCDWLHVCNPLSCSQNHVRDLIYWVCLCCPESRYLSQCVHCSRLA